MNKDLDERIETFAKLLYKSRYSVFFTGAGISTESGLPDFRGPDGIWTRQDKGLAPRPVSKPWDSFEPNSSHLAIVDLQNIGKLKFLISQNVDNLHLKSGIRFDLLAELHGNITRFCCKGWAHTAKYAVGSAQLVQSKFALLLVQCPKSEWRFDNANRFGGHGFDYCARARTWHIRSIACFPFASYRNYDWEDDTSCYYRHD